MCIKFIHAGLPFVSSHCLWCVCAAGHASLYTPVDQRFLVFYGSFRFIQSVKHNGYSFTVGYNDRRKIVLQKTTPGDKQTVLKVLKYITRRWQLCKSHNCRQWNTEHWHLHIWTKINYQCNSGNYFYHVSGTSMLSFCITVLTRISKTKQ